MYCILDEFIRHIFQFNNFLSVVSVLYWVYIYIYSCYHILSLFLSELTLMRQIRWFQGTHIRTVLSSKSESRALGKEQCSSFYWIQISLHSEPAWVRTHGHSAEERCQWRVGDGIWKTDALLASCIFSSYCIIKAKY